METTSSVPIASESFSYSWLSSNSKDKSPLELGLDESTLRKSIHSSYGGTPEEFMSSVILTSDSLQSGCRNFIFDTSITHHHSPFVHADELFSDGILRPVFVDTSKVELCSNNTPDPSQTKLDSSSSLFSKNASPRTMEIHHHHGFLKRWRKSTREILVYFLRYVNQLCPKVRHSRKSNRINDIDKTELQVKNLSSSKQQASPKPITTHPIVDLHDHENSIYEAVLHCKRSVGK